MNLPNKLTVLRIIMIPFFIYFLMYNQGEDSLYRGLALAVFIIAALTDTLDGIIARKYKLITNFGKFMDPLADKLLVCSALICPLSRRRVPGRQRPGPSPSRASLKSERNGMPWWPDRDRRASCRERV